MKIYDYNLVSKHSVQPPDFVSVLAKRGKNEPGFVASGTTAILGVDRRPRVEFFDGTCYVWARFHHVQADGSTR